MVHGLRPLDVGGSLRHAGKDRGIYVLVGGASHLLFRRAACICCDIEGYSCGGGQRPRPSGPFGAWPSVGGFSRSLASSFAYSEEETRSQANPREFRAFKSESRAIKRLRVRARFTSCHLSILRSGNLKRGCVAFARSPVLRPHFGRVQAESPFVF